jgi:hypothetical protein
VFGAISCAVLRSSRAFTDTSPTLPTTGAAPDTLSFSMSWKWWPGTDRFAKRIRTAQLPAGRGSAHADPRQSNHRRADFQSRADGWDADFINRRAEAPVASSAPRCSTVQNRFPKDCRSNPGPHDVLEHKNSPRILNGKLELSTAPGRQASPKLHAGVTVLVRHKRSSPVRGRLQILTWGTRRWAELI